MRTALLFAFLVAGSLSNAQNWALINPAHKYNYSLGGTDTITNQMFVTDIDTLGVDSFRYALNRVGLVCDTCEGMFTSVCGGAQNVPIVQGNLPQFIGSSVSRNTIFWQLEGVDTLSIYPHAMPGTNWIENNGNIGTVLSLEAMPVFGNLDSVKNVAYSNGDTVLISKEHGLLEFGRSSFEPLNYQLVGMKGLMEEGAQFPTLIDLFNYQSGDALQYSEERSFQDSFCVWFVSAIVKYIILERIDEPERTDYAVRRIRSESGVAYYPQQWQPCGNTSFHLVDTIVVGIDHEQWTADNVFMADWSTPLFPGAIGAVGYNGSSFSDRTLLRSTWNESQGYTIETYISEPLAEYGIMCPSVEDTSVILVDDNIRYYCSYLEGVGLTRRSNYLFESGEVWILEGHFINGVETGTVTPDGILLGVPEVIGSTIQAVYPNPATDQITLTGLRIGSNVSIFDVQGRISINQRSNDPLLVLDISHLEQGVYFIQSTDSRPQRFIITR